MLTLTSISFVRRTNRHIPLPQLMTPCCAPVRKKPIPSGLGPHTLRGPGHAAGSPPPARGGPARLSLVATILVPRPPSRGLRPLVTLRVSPQAAQGACGGHFTMHLSGWTNDFLTEP